MSLDAVNVSPTCGRSKTNSLCATSGADLNNNNNNNFEEGTCKNGGICSDLWSDFHCTCPKVKAGKFCTKEPSPLIFGADSYVELRERESYARDRLLTTVREVSAPVSSAARRTRAAAAAVGSGSGNFYTAAASHPLRHLSFDLRTTTADAVLLYASHSNSFTLLMITHGQLSYVTQVFGKLMKPVTVAGADVANGEWNQIALVLAQVF